MLTISNQEIVRKSKNKLTTYILAVIAVWLIILNVLILRPEKKSELKVIESIDHRTVKMIEINDNRTIKVIDKREKKESPKLTGNQIVDLIYQTFPEDPHTALAIAMAESGLDPKAFNGSNSDGSNDKGVFQINSCHGYGEELYDIETNLKVARKIYDKSGWLPWSSYKLGRHLTYLNK